MPARRPAAPATRPAGAYNADMHTHRWIFPALLLGAAASAWAQAAADAPLVRDATPRDGGSQRIEHIQVEDAGSRINELRVGGQTQSISVQPRAAMPQYDVQPASASRLPPNEAGPGSAGPRTWKVLQF